MNNMPLCSRCKKNVAVVFITKLENGKSTNEGLCIKCAKELGIKPVTDFITKFGISDEMLDSMEEELNNGGQLMAGLMSPEQDAEQDEDIPSRAPAMPFFNSLMRQPQKREEEKEEPKKGRENKKKKFLPLYATDLTQRAREGRLDSVIGRQEEINRVVQILNRRQKNNPCLIGEPGVGKTAVAEGLAGLIASGDAPYKLQDKEVWLLDMTAMVAGTQFRGQFEARMKNLIDEVKALGNIILVIDEVHNLVGAGDAEGSMNAANILKPALSRGDIQVIGATTFKEYRKNIEKDAALERRFQPVIINEPTSEQTYEILLGIRGYYEKYHHVRITPESARQAVYLADRYINDRFMPDKAIDLIDEACSDVNLHNQALNEMMKLQNELNDISKKREELMAQENKDESFYARVAELKTAELHAQNRMQELSALPDPELTVDDLARVIELWTKIPASRVREQDFKRIALLDSRLKARVIGQDEAVDAVVAAIRRRRAGISQKLKPVSFVFVGPTGVGKTELVKQLASELFDTPDALIRLDMSEYMEKHSVSKLIGAPPGYVGYDEAGQLTEKIRRRPYSVVLFDEIEKAHPDVLNMLLQILDDGRITDAQGRYINFENTVIIMTSNAGSDRRDGAVGFGRTVTEQGREKALKALSEVMRPEFINRIDEVISFNQLSKEDFSRIAGIMLSDLRQAMDRAGIEFSWDDALVNYLTEKSFSIRFGARNLRRLIEKEVEDKAAGMIMESYDDPVTVLRATSDGEKVILTR